MFHTGLIVGQIVNIAMNDNAEYGDVYFDESNETVGSRKNQKVYYSLRNISSTKSKVYGLMIVTYQSGSVQKSNFEFIVVKGNSEYNYIVEVKYAIDIDNTTSQIWYFKTAKKNNTTDFDYASYVDAGFGSNLTTILNSTQIVESDIDTSWGGGVYNIATLKAKVGQKTNVVNALNGLKTHVSTYTNLQTMTLTRTDFFVSYNQLITSS